MVEFGEQLRKAREAKGMTQQSLAEQLYVTRQSVSRWECGDRYSDQVKRRRGSEINGIGRCIERDSCIAGVIEGGIVMDLRVGVSAVVMNWLIMLYFIILFFY